MESETENVESANGNAGDPYLDFVARQIATLTGGKLEDNNGPELFVSSKFDFGRVALFFDTEGRQITHSMTEAVKLREAIASLGREATIELYDAEAKKVYGDLI